MEWVIYWLLKMSMFLLDTTSAYLIRMIWFRNCNFGDCEVRTCCARSRRFNMDCFLNFCCSFYLHRVMKKSCWKWCCFLNRNRFHWDIDSGKERNIKKESNLFWYMNFLLFRSWDMFLRRNIDRFNFFSDNMTFCWDLRNVVCYSVLFITIFQSFLLYISFICLFWLPGWSNTCLINCCNDCSYSFSLFSSLSLQITLAEFIHIFIIILKTCIYDK